MFHRKLIDPSKEKFGKVCAIESIDDILIVFDILIRFAKILRMREFLLPKTTKRRNEKRIKFNF